MYAKELLKTGDTKDFQDAKPIFQYILEHDLSDDAMKEASCVLAHVYRLEDNKNEFFQADDEGYADHSMFRDLL